MRKIRTLLAAVTAAGPVLVAAAPSAGAGEPVVAIVGATVFDGTGAAPRQANVLIRDGRILDVGPKVRIPAGARVIRADGEALLPGFFDVHTHWTPRGEPDATPQIAAAYLAAGVTTVNDFNAAPESFEPRRKWLSSLTAPHVRFVARISTPGGHGADWSDQTTTRWISTPEGARAAIRSLVPYKPDAIKAFTDGWRYGTAPDNTSMDAGTLGALVDEAHKNQWRVLTHTVTVERGRAAAGAKVDVIAHGLQDRDLDAATVGAIKAAGTANAPTLAVYDPEKTGRARDRSDPRVQQSFRKFEIALQNVKRLHDAGVPIALGTDAGMPDTPHGVSTLKEMELLVRAGLTPSEALMAATSTSAKVLGLIDDRGTIEKGKRADLLLIKGAPWRDIADVRRTDRVFLDGRLIHGPGAPVRTESRAKAPAAVKAVAQIDDFERPDGRSSLDTLRMEDPDGGMDRTVEISQVIDRAVGGGRALSVSARMSVKKRPYAGVLIPLTRGSIQPVDARGFKGVKLELRGDGPYEVMIRGVSGSWSAKVEGGPAWRTIEVPFSAFVARNEDDEKGGGALQAGELTDVGVTGSRPAGERMWLELDNLTFY